MRQKQNTPASSNTGAGRDSLALGGADNPKLNQKSAYDNVGVLYRVFPNDPSYVAFERRFYGIAAQSLDQLIEAGGNGLLLSDQTPALKKSIAKLRKQGVKIDTDYSDAAGNLVPANARYVLLDKVRLAVEDA
jgi:winged helix domain-containing protein